MPTEPLTHPHAIASPAANAARPPAAAALTSATVVLGLNLVTLGPAALGLSIGLQLMMSCIVLFGPRDVTALQGTLLLHGKQYVRPENDLYLYALGMGLSVAATIGAVAGWRWLMRRVNDQSERFLRISAAWCTVLAAASLVLYLLILATRIVSGAPIYAPVIHSPPVRLVDAVLLFTPAIGALITILIDLTRAGPALARLWNRLTASPARLGVTTAVFHAAVLLFLLLDGADDDRVFVDKAR